jgi:hypothetical protein
MAPARNVNGHSLATHFTIPELDAGSILAGVCLGMGGAIYGLIAARMVSPRRISDEYVWLKGVHRDFLNELPDWPYQP